MRLARQLQSDGGYSLLELLIVLAIFALGAAVTMPQLSSVRPSMSGRIAERTLIDELHRLRADAIRTNRGQWLEVAADGRSIETSTGRRIALAGDARINAVTRTVTQRMLRFHPDGRSSGAVWTLSGDGSPAVIRVDWLTGAVDVEGRATP